jgi:diguanylate cyclase (GGDEF)-like protein
LTTREHAQQRLAEATLTYDELLPTTAALIEIEQAVHDGDGVDDRLLHGIADTVRNILAEVQLAGRYAERQFLLVLPQDDLQHATERAEQVRQRVAATQYVADGQELQATVTCALAQVAAGHTADNLLQFLEETLEEAKRYGGNRTFMHDGTAPTPVVPPELNIAPQTCAI